MRMVNKDGRWKWDSLIATLVYTTVGRYIAIQHR